MFLSLSQGADLDNDSESSPGNHTGQEEAMDSDAGQYSKDRRDSVQQENRLMTRQLWPSTVSCSEKEEEESEEDEKVWEVQKRQSWHKRVNSRRHKKHRQGKDSSDKQTESKSSESRTPEKFGKTDSSYTESGSIGERPISASGISARTGSTSKSSKGSSSHGSHERKSAILEEKFTFKEMEARELHRQGKNRKDESRRLTTEKAARAEAESRPRSKGVEYKPPPSHEDEIRRYVSAITSKRRKSSTAILSVKPQPSSRLMQRRSTDVLLETAAFGNSQSRRQTQERYNVHGSERHLAEDELRPFVYRPGEDVNRTAHKWRHRRSSVSKSEPTHTFQFNVEFVDVPSSYVKQRRPSMLDEQEEVFRIAAAHLRRQSIGGGDAQLLGYDLRKTNSRRRSADDAVKSKKKSKDHLRRYSADDQYNNIRRKSDITPIAETKPSRGQEVHELIDIVNDVRNALRPPTPGGEDEKHEVSESVDFHPRKISLRRKSVDTELVKHIPLSRRSSYASQASITDDLADFINIYRRHSADDRFSKEYRENADDQSRARRRHSAEDEQPKLHPQRPLVSAKPPALSARRFSLFGEEPAKPVSLPKGRRRVSLGGEKIYLQQPVSISTLRAALPALTSRINQRLTEEEEQDGFYDTLRMHPEKKGRRSLFTTSSCSDVI